MTDATNIDAAEAAARSLLDARLEPIRDLAAAREDVQEVLDQLTAAVKSYAAAHAASTTVGWTGTDLIKLDYYDPKKLAEMASKTVTQAMARKVTRGSAAASRTRAEKKTEAAADVPGQRAQTTEETVAGAAPAGAEAVQQ